MNHYVGLCRLGAWLDSLPASCDLVPLPPICLIVVFLRGSPTNGFIRYKLFVLGPQSQGARHVVLFEFRFPELRPDYLSAVAGGA